MQIVKCFFKKYTYLPLLLHARIITYPSTSTFLLLPSYTYFPLLFLSLKSTFLIPKNTPLAQLLHHTIILSEIGAFIQNNLHQKITAKNLAAKAGMSITAFRIAFLQQYGCNVFAFLQKQRMQLAHRLLIQNYLPLKQIAATCGYQHTSHFNRAVKKHFGLPPAQIRQQAITQKKVETGNKSTP